MSCSIEWPEPIVRVQSLSESGLRAIPARYIKPEPDRPADVVTPDNVETINIPIIDLGAPEKVKEACKEWGFFQITNHGIRPELLDGAREAWREFFHQPMEVKQKYANNPKTYEGYGSRLGVEKGAILDWSDYFFLHFRPHPLRDPRKWPSHPTHHREVMEEYLEEVLKLSGKLMKMLSTNLGLQENALQDAFGGDDIGACLRVNFYPKCPQPDLTLGLSSHSDPGGITVLLPDPGVAGLQVRKEGRWVTVKPAPHAFIINIGDQMQVKAVTEEMGIGFLGIGFQPKWGIKDIPVMPKGRYEIMRNYMPKVGSLGLDMMFRTCTVQVNLDFDSEADMIRKFRVGLALQPIATALFANSPFTEGKPNGYLSKRSHIWTDTDNNRSGMLPFVFDDSFGFEQYVDYALDVPMYFVYRNKNYVDCSGMSFRDFLAGKLPALPGDYPTLNDWENHLTTIFPEVRLKRYLEMRGADGGPWRRLCALPAFWVGLLYDEVSLQSVLDMTADWTQEEREMLRNKVPKTGLKTPFRDGYVKHLAEDVLKLAKDGLERRGYKEVGFLNEVAEVVRTGVTPAERLLKLYHEKWGQSVDPVFEELLY